MSEETITNAVEVEKVEQVEAVEEVDELEPVYYKPKMLNLVAMISGIFSWVVLLGFIALTVGQFLVLQELGQGAPWSTLVVNPQVKNWIYSNLVLPMLTGLSLFIVLQGVALGLNVLLEIDFNLREARI